MDKQNRVHDKMQNSLCGQILQPSKDENGHFYIAGKTKIIFYKINVKYAHLYILMAALLCPQRKPHLITRASLMSSYYEITYVCDKPDDKSYQLKNADNRKSRPQA